MKNNQKESIGIAIAGLGFGEAVHLPALNATSSLKPIGLWHAIYVTSIIQIIAKLTILKAMVLNELSYRIIYNYSSLYSISLYQ